MLKDHLLRACNLVDFKPFQNLLEALDQNCKTMSTANGRTMQLKIETESFIMKSPVFVSPDFSQFNPKMIKKRGSLRPP